MKLHRKQTIAIDRLEDKITEQVFFGGAAGGGKSALGCYWTLKNRIKYPGTRGLIGRSKLTTLKNTTLKTFFEVAEMQGFKDGKNMNYSEGRKLITFPNNSEIFLKDLFYYPSDQNLDDLGSLEITDAFVDEAPQIKQRVKDVLKSRIRFKIKDFGLCQKMLLVGNPSKNWVYHEFYLPNKEKSLSREKAFIQSLLDDNPYISEEYRKGLLSLSTVDKERLLYGNWEYEDTEDSLFIYSDLTNAFTNNFIIEPNAKRYITADIALHGNDLFVVGVWFGWTLEKVFSFKKIEPEDVEKFLKDTAQAFRVPRGNIVYDADGLGTYLRGYLRGAIAFNNNAKARNRENYQNIKTQCIFKLSEKIGKNEVYIKDQQFKERIIEEFEQIKKVNTDREEKLKVTAKQRIKELLGRSPDYSDMIIMRAVFIYKETTGVKSTMQL